jgi:predicted amidohydrolase
MKLALVQHTMVEDMQTNLDNALSAMDEAASNDANVVCFPEIQLSPFFPQYQGQDAKRYALTLDSDIVKKLQKKCAELNLCAFPNIYLQQDGKYFDATLVIGPTGELLGTAKMVHIAQVPCFYEQDYYEPSDTGFQVFPTPYGNIGVVVCFDRHYPESIRTCVLKGADLIIIPTANTKAEPTELFEWELRVPAMQNGVFIAMCNRTGLEGEMDFSGESILVDPSGDVLAKANDQVQILYADIDLHQTKEAREKRPYLPLRRPDVYL